MKCAINNFIQPNRNTCTITKITEYGIKCCMHAHHVAPRAPPNRGELYRRKTLFFDDFPIFFSSSKWDLDPPTHFQIIFGFFEFFLTLQSPLAGCTALSASVPRRERCVTPPSHQRAAWIFNPRCVGNVREQASHLCPSF